MPNYNKAEFLSQTLNAVLAQSYPNWELIIVDDQSEDHSLEIINDFKRRDNRIQLHFNSSETRNGSTCRNLGIQAASGDFIMFLDSDDLLDEQCLQQRVELMESEPSLDFMVFPMGSFYNELGDNDFVWRPFKEEALTHFISHQLPWAICQPLWKKEFIDSHFLTFDCNLKRLQDVDFHIQALFQNPKFEVFSHSKPDCYYRISEKRKVWNALLFYSNWLTSCEHMLRKYAGHPEASTKALNQFKLMSISELINAKNKQYLSERELKEVSETSSFRFLLGTNTSTLSVYWLVAYNAPFHIPGLRRIFKSLLALRFKINLT